MASTHGGGVLQASASNAAGATTTSSTLDNSTAYGAIITAKVTNGATGPTVGATAYLNVSYDGITWDQWAIQPAGVIANAAYALQFVVPPETIKAQIVFTGNTGQAVTVEARYQQLTGI